MRLFPLEEVPRRLLEVRLVLIDEAVPRLRIPDLYPLSHACERQVPADVRVRLQLVGNEDAAQRITRNLRGPGEKETLKSPRVRLEMVALRERGSKLLERSLVEEEEAGVDSRREEELQRLVGLLDGLPELGRDDDPVLVVEGDRELAVKHSFTGCAPGLPKSSTSSHHGPKL